MADALAATRFEADGPNGPLHAAAVPHVQFVDAEVCNTRLGAWLRPFPAEQEALAALAAAGGRNVRKVGAK